MEHLVRMHSFVETDDAFHERVVECVADGLRALRWREPVDAEGASMGFCLKEGLLHGLAAFSSPLCSPLLRQLLGRPDNSWSSFEVLRYDPLPHTDADGAHRA
jgi:hypothetical protein